MDTIKNILCIIGIFLFIILGVYLLIKSSDDKKRRMKSIQEMQNTIQETNAELDELLDTLEQLNQPVKDVSDFFKQLNEKLFTKQ